MTRITAMQEEIREMKSEIRWIKKIGYYIATIMTAQLGALLVIKL